MSRARKLAFLAVGAVLVLLGVLAAPCKADAQGQLVSEAERKDGWFPLFNGVDLTGWTATGAHPEAFYVKDGVIECDGSGGGWLRTDKQFENFILRIEYKLTKGANSGIAIRALPQGSPAFSGMEIQLLDDHGKRPRAYTTGAIYDSVAPTKNTSRPAGEWNEMEITCNDRQVKVALNGTEIVDTNLDDYTTPINNHTPLKDRATCGLIELQDHTGHHLWFRNIRIKPLPGGVGWRPLFNREDLTGWRTVGTAKWQVKDGVLVGSQGQGHIFTKSAYDNLILRTSLRISSHGNSGVYFRVQDLADWPEGYEAQVDHHDPNNPTGSLYGMCKAANVVTRDGEWFTMQVTADGPHIVIEVNGETVVDTHDTTFQGGMIALQAHDPSSVVQYRDVEIKLLP
jgi:hypothetical protein